MSSNDFAGYNYAPVTNENGPLSAYAIGETVTKTVRTVNCVYYSESFQVYQVEAVDNPNRHFSIVGTFPYKLSLNAYYNISGTVAEDKRRERQLKVISCEMTMPTDYNGIITVLKTLHGLDTQAYKLYEKVGPDVLNLLRTDPEKVAGMVKGIGKKRARDWQMELIARGENDRELKKLYRLGLTAQQAAKLVADRGISVCSEVESDPYKLMELARGFTFKKCDKIALSSGRIGIDNPDRLRAGIRYVLADVENRGHCACPETEFMANVHALVDFSLNSKEAYSLMNGNKHVSVIRIKWGIKTYPISLMDLRCEMDNWRSAIRSKDESFRYIVDSVADEYITSAIKDLMTGGHMVREEAANGIYYMSSALSTAEADIVSYAGDFTANEMFPLDNAEETLNRILAERNITLEAKQREAVLRICRAKGGIFVLNGSAGCGKTFTLNIIIMVLRELYSCAGGSLDPCVLAPTGKAAKVASKVTGLPAYTIHKALGLVSSDLSANQYSEDSSGHALNNNCVVVDEFSMVDEILCAQLLRGISKTAKVILLGDTAQLPSVRPGRVLKDLIESNKIPVITLDVVKRQKSGSGVFENAKKIAAGEDIATYITNENGTQGNAYVIDVRDRYAAQNQIIETASKYGLQAFQNGDVQVLAPMKAGVNGVHTLNTLLQENLNPGNGRPEIVVGKVKVPLADGREEERSSVYRVGDVVIHTKNNYKQPWFAKHPINGYIETSSAGVVNGDTGVISDIYAYKDGSGISHRVIYVKYDDHYICYENEFDELMLAYAMTIHKSQGSQWPTIICPISQFSILLNRKLMYTMYTRAQDTHILIGNPAYVHSAIENDHEDRRCTLLSEKLTRK